MKNKIIILSVLGLIIVSVIIFTSIKLLKNLDVVGKQSLNSFKEITTTLTNNIKLNEESTSWILSSPDNSAKFIWSTDFSKTSNYDVMLEFSIDPFIKAGLDKDKLPIEMVSNDVIILGTELSDKKINYDGDFSSYESYKKIVELNRNSIKYHAELDHYGIDLGNGNLFEWAKDMTINDKDIVFVLNPEPFINAGVNPEEVDGWVYAKVPTMKDGKKVEVYKLLKPFNLK